MARIPYLDVSDVAPEHRDLMKRNINLYRALVHSPGALRAFQGLGYYIRNSSKLDPRLRELAILQVGWLARAPFEWSHHIAIGLDAGVTDADIRSLMAGDDGATGDLDPAARLVLRGAREMTLDGRIHEATLAELGQRLGTELLVDLVMTISFYNAVVRVLATLEIDVEPEYLHYLKAYPLPEN